jgi:hypothetical protein
MADTPLSSDKEKLDNEGVHSEDHEPALGTNPAAMKHAGDSDGAEIDFSGVDKATVLRKMDYRLIPVLAVLYLLSFLDRG